MCASRIDSRTKIHSATRYFWKPLFLENSNKMNPFQAKKSSIAHAAYIACKVTASKHFLVRKILIRIFFLLGNNTFQQTYSYHNLGRAQATWTVRAILLLFHYFDLCEWALWKFAQPQLSKKIDYGNRRLSFDHRRPPSNAYYFDKNKNKNVDVRFYKFIPHLIIILLIFKNQLK